MKDLRLNEVSFNISNSVECEEVYRDICSHMKVAIGKAKAFTDAQSVIKDVQIFKLCRGLNLRMEVDFLRDKCTIFYPDKENKVVSFPGQEEVKKEEKPLSDGTQPQPPAEEIKTEIVPGSTDDDDPDLF